MKIQISPSILSADYGNLEPELRRITAAGADMVHIDVMDGHFVPNITLGAPIVKCIRHATDLPFDVHLMISDPQKYIPDFLSAGADSITFHIESDGDTDETVDLILQSGKKAAMMPSNGSHALTSKIKPMLVWSASHPKNAEPMPPSPNISPKNTPATSPTLSGIKSVAYTTIEENAEAIIRPAKNAQTTVATSPK